MKLGELRKRKNLAFYSGVGRSGSGLDTRTYNSIKSQVHFSLVKKLDLASVADMPKEELSFLIKQTLQDIASREKLPLNQDERTTLISDLLNEILGLGPIEPLMQDESIQDILVNGHSSVYIERRGVLELTPIRFRDDEHLMQIIDRIVSSIGRRVDESSPMVDARLEDGSRVNVIIHPLALDGPILSIRKFGQNPLTIDDLISYGTLPAEIAAYLEAAVKSKLNILISGGTGAGKTTLLNILAGYIPDNERIITIEDSAELRLQQPHVVRLESRPANVEGKGEVTLTDLVRNSLRMRPDRIIVGESRGAEVLDMLQAMNTGHPGSMSTIHANSPKDALSRMEVMLSMGTSVFSEMAMKALLGSAINIIVQLARLPDGKRILMSVSEMAGTAGDDFALQDLFKFEQYGVDARGNIYGCFKATGKVSMFLDHMKSHGLELEKEIFRLVREVR